MAFENGDVKLSSLPLKLCWTFGHENKIPAYNISTPHEKRICYISGSVAISYDWINNKQTILEGHANDIQCIAVSSDKSVLATFDSGVNNALILWDLDTNSSMSSLDNFCKNGVSCMQFSPDNSYLIVLSSNLPDGGQELYVWNFLAYGEEPALIYNIPKDYESQHYIAIHPIDCNHFLTSNKKNVIFFRVVEGLLLAHAPTLNQEDFQKPIGFLTQTIYVPHAQLVLSATTLGNFLSWGNKKAKGQIIQTSAFVDPENRIPIRLIQPHVAKMKIHFLSMYKQWLVSGDSLGHVHFYDTELQVLKSFKEFDQDSIIHISFTPVPFSVLEDQSESDENSSELYIQNFTISTASGYCGYCSVKENKLIDILEARESCIRAIATSSLRPYVCLGDHSGQIQLWNLEMKKLENTAFLKGSCKEIECLAFDETCTYLACGLSDGHIYLFDVPALTRTPNFTFNIFACKICMIAFSPDSQFLTFVDECCAIAVFRLYCILSTRSIIGKSAGKERADWDLIGKQRQHYLPIVDVTYRACTTKENLMLLTLGQDRYLVGYNLDDSSKEGMVILFTLRVEQTAIPTSMCWYPCFDRPSLLAIANNEHKVKIFSMESQKCVKLNLLPIYDSPIRKMLVVKEPTEDEDQLKCFAFKTDHSFGLLMLPIDGNPNRARAIHSHTINYLCNIVKDCHDRYLFSSGMSDKWVHMWKIDYKILQGPHSSYNSLDPFLVIASKGNINWMKREIMDIALSLTLQRIEGQFPACIRLENKILISDLVYIFAAIGYYPSNYEILLIENDIRFTSLQTKGETSFYIDFDDFVRLYVNHRPVKETKLRELIEACMVAFDLKVSTQFVPREQFQKILGDSGEPIDEEELIALLAVLADETPPSIEMNDLYVQCELDKSYYDGGMFPEKKVYKRVYPYKTEEEIDWGELDIETKEHLPVDEECKEEVEKAKVDEHADKFKKLQDLQDEHEKILSAQVARLRGDKVNENVEVKKGRTLESLLPQSISLDHIIHKLLGYSEAKKKKRRGEKRGDAPESSSSSSSDDEE